MATEVHHQAHHRRETHRQGGRIQWGVVGLVALLVLLFIGYTGLVHVNVNTSVDATAHPVAATTVARVGAVTLAPTPVTTQVIERVVTVVPGAGATVVTVTARDGVTVRSQPNTASNTLGQVPVGSDLTVTGADVLDPGGISRWIPVRYQGIEGFVRSDLVDTPHVA